MSKRNRKNRGPQAVVEETVEAISAPESADEQSSQVADIEVDLEALQIRLAETEAALAEERNLYIRGKAEIENVRKRAENDVRNARKFGVEEFAIETLAVRDSLEIARALEIDSEDAGALKKMQEGLDLTLRQLDNVFSKFNIQVVDPSPGEKLNPEQHQAMSIVESDEIAANHIISVVQKGYLLHERLLRPAMVIVAKAVSAEPTESAVSEP